MVLRLFAGLWQTFLARLIASQGCQSVHTDTYACFACCFEKLDLMLAVRLLEATIQARGRRRVCGGPSGAKRQSRDSVRTKMACSSFDEHEQWERRSSVERLVPVSFMHCCTSTPGLSTWSSSTALIGNTRFQVGFPLRCLQRLSRPYIATLLCRWRDNRSTRDMSIPVLSY